MTAAQLCANRHAGPSRRNQIIVIDLHLGSCECDEDSYSAMFGSAHSQRLYILNDF